mgnify:CR=1 FL=1
MIDIRCAKIENCRQQPGLYGKMIALKQKLGERTNGNFSAGMCSKWRTAAMAVHRGLLQDSARNGLEFALSLFTSKACTEKQELYLDAFTDYFEQLNAEGWQFVCGGKLISWEGLHDSVRLTGQSPWIMERCGEYQCHFVTESPVPGWQYQLKYPLLQQYIATHILDCNPQQVAVGLYSIADRQFILQQYNEQQLQDSVREAKAIFHDMHHAFEKELHSI